jgi:hypothetical protein
VRVEIFVFSVFFAVEIRTGDSLLFDSRNPPAHTRYRKGKSLWQNGKSGFNASRSRFGFLPLAIAVSVFL